MEISIKEIETTIKEILYDSEVLNTDSVYEQIEDSDDLKLIIFFNKLFSENSSILYTKLIFKVNKEKTKLVNNSFMYLYDINCIYNNVNFNNLKDFKNKFSTILKEEDFGKDLKILSQFIEKPAFLLNEWFKKNNVDLNISNVKYDPKIYIIPCKSLFFSFIININNTDIEMTITKEKDDLFKYSFKIYDKFVNFEKNNLNTLIETIGDTLKTNIK